MKSDCLQCQLRFNYLAFDLAHAHYLTHDLAHTKKILTLDFALAKKLNLQIFCYECVQMSKLLQWIALESFHFFVFSFSSYHVLYMYMYIIIALISRLSPSNRTNCSVTFDQVHILDRMKLVWRQSSGQWREAIAGAESCWPYRVCGHPLCSLPTAPGGACYDSGSSPGEEDMSRQCMGRRDTHTIVLNIHVYIYNIMHTHLHCKEGHAISPERATQLYVSELGIKS